MSGNAKVGNVSSKSGKGLEGFQKGFLKSNQEKTKVVNLELTKTSDNDVEIGKRDRALDREDGNQNKWGRSLEDESEYSSNDEHDDEDEVTNLM
jgi:hypothetical protein